MQIDAFNTSHIASRFTVKKMACCLVLASLLPFSACSSEESQKTDDSGASATQSNPAQEGLKTTNNEEQDELVTDISGTPPLKDKSQIIFLHLVFNDSLLKGKIKEAREAVEDLLYLDPSPQVYREAMNIYEMLSDDAKVEETASYGLKLYPEDASLHLQYADFLARKGQADKAIEQLTGFIRHLEKKFQGSTPPPKGVEGAQQEKERGAALRNAKQMLIRLYMNQEQYQEALKLIRGMRDAEFTPEVRFLEAQILKNQGQADAAHEKLINLVKKYPEFTEGWLDLATEAGKAGKYSEAVIFYKKALAVNDLPQIYLLLLNATIQSGDIPESLNLVKEQSYGPETALQSALLFFENGKKEEGRQLLHDLRKDPAVGDDAVFYLAFDALDSNYNVDDALALLSTVKMEGANKQRIMHIKAALLMEKGDYPAALQLAKELTELYPDNTDLWLFRSEANNQAKQYEEAEAVALEALKKWPDHPALLYSYGLSLGLQKKDDAAMKAMEKILQQEPDNSLALNYIGYSLAEQNKELDRALELINKALEQEPDSFYILDSLAWVYYRQGHMNKAWEAISKSIAHGADDPTVWEHYGDIAGALGKKDEARKGYENALKKSPDNAADIRVRLNKLK